MTSLDEFKTISHDRIAGVMEQLDSYGRLGYLIGLRADPLMKQTLGTDNWLKLLGAWWCGCDNVWMFQHQLNFLLPDKGPVAQMMTPEELGAYEALPDIVTVYRGCGAHNAKGCSWTLERDTAAQFPFLNRYRVPDPILITGRVAKADVMAVKLDREEGEVIAFFDCVQVVRREPLSEAKAVSG